MYLIKVKENAQIISKFPKVEQAKKFLGKYYNVMTKKYPCQLGKNTLKINMNGHVKTYIIQKAS